MEQRTITLGHSPDPDDAFMFYALTRGKIDTAGFAFEETLSDIETLNQMADREELDITAVSVHAYAYLADRYALLACGASMGEGYGPMVVAREPLELESLGERVVAIPGERTSAFLALRMAIGTFDYRVVPFDRIMDVVSAGEADVLSVSVEKTGERMYRFSVKVQHGDEGWNHYADGWDVVAPDGTVLGTRVLYHPHVEEQPFTRSLSGVRIPEGIEKVTVRARDAYGNVSYKSVEVTVK